MLEGKAHLGPHHAVPCSINLKGCPLAAGHIKGPLDVLSPRPGYNHIYMCTLCPALVTWDTVYKLGFIWRSGVIRNIKKMGYSKLTLRGIGTCPVVLQYPQLVLWSAGQRAGKEIHTGGETNSTRLEPTLVSHYVPA